MRHLTDDRWLAPHANSLKIALVWQSSSKPFSILKLLYHECDKKSNVFLGNTNVFLIYEKYPLTNPFICA